MILFSRGCESVGDEQARRVLNLLALVAPDDTGLKSLAGRLASGRRFMPTGGKLKVRQTSH